MTPGKHSWVFKEGYKGQRKKGCGTYRRGIWVPKFERKENEIRIVKMEKSKVTDNRWGAGETNGPLGAGQLCKTIKPKLLSVCC